jgi:predicted phosphoribosyltransferase/erythromycin esterase-like protein
MEPERFCNRNEAGRLLAKKLTAYANRPDVLVFALPRGGVPVAYEVARALGAPLDFFVVRKLGIPGYEELAMGAVATGGVRVLNDEIVRRLRIPEYIIDAVAAREQQELARRERLYRGGRPPPDVRGRTVILVDDGLATGATMRAAIMALRQLQPARIIVAIPTASPETCEELKAEVDEVVCAITPEPFLAVGHWYEDFSQTTDEEVRDLLARRQHPEAEQTAQGTTDTGVLDTVRKAARPLTGTAGDYHPLMELIGESRFVLLGEALHGTHEFYHERARITQRLINEKGFTAVAVEEALSDFRRFPRWMWRNTDVVDFVKWLRTHNDTVSSGSRKAGFYGLDLYSLHASMKAVIQYLERVDPDAAGRARARYACFDHFGPDPQIYGFMAATDRSKSCRDEVVSQLVELRRRATEYARRDGRIAEDELFYAEQNARLVKNAEEYYRSMFFEKVSSWNLRDGHMVETLDALVAHISRRGGPAKVVVWAHNSHLGDARATEMGRRGELNVGQLMREKFGRDVVLVGFTTRITALSLQPPTGEESVNASASGQRFPAAMRRCSTPSSLPLPAHLASE